MVLWQRFRQSNLFVILRLTLAIAFVLSLLAVPYRLHHAPAKTSYRAEEISLPGYEISYLTAINERGEVAGFGLKNANTDWARPFVWSGGKIRELGLPTDAVAGLATDINEQGEISGSFVLPEGKTGAIVWSKNGWRGIAFCGKGNIWGMSIGDDGAALCGAQTEDHPEPFSLLWTEENLRLLGPFIPTDRDKAGNAIGVTGDCQSGYRAITFHDGKVTPLPTPQQFKESLANSLNNRGQIVGAVVKGDDIPLPVLWEEGGKRMRILDKSRPGFAYSINDRGQVVGAQEGDSEKLPVKAVLWEDGKAISLTEAVSDKGWKLYAAFDINGRGQIVGMGERNGRLCGFRLTPQN
jgi:uncharacterized membrane protein